MSRIPLQIVAESQKRGEGALTEKREKVMLELDKLQRYVEISYIHPEICTRDKTSGCGMKC
jgi:hypothetical protein